jgi:hypothetical protein
MPAIIHLIGQPASGKLTTARALVALAAERGHTIALVDNHTTGNVILGLLDIHGGSVLGPPVWDRVRQVREIVYETIESLGTPAWSYLFTNVLSADDPADAAAVDRLATLAERTGRRYLPVVLTCDDAELLRRIPNPDRAERGKWTDPETVADHLATRPLLDLGERAPLVLDTTASRPADTAARILESLDHDRPLE